MISIPHDEGPRPIEERADRDAKPDDTIARRRPPHPSADPIPVARHEPLELPDTTRRD